MESADQFQVLLEEIKALRREVQEMKTDTGAMTEHINFMHVVYEHVRNPVNSFLSSIHAVSKWISYQEDIQFLTPSTRTITND